MKDSVTIPIKLLNSLKKDQNLVIYLKDLIEKTSNPDDFYKKCKKLLESNSKIEEKLKNK